MRLGFFRSVGNAISSAAHATRRAFTSGARATAAIARADNAPDPRGQYVPGGITSAMAGRPSLFVPAPPATAASGAIPKRGASQPPAAQATISKQPEGNPPLDTHELNFRLGEKIGHGWEGGVYQDTASANHVIKKVILGTDPVERVKAVEMCTAQVLLFNKYYGKNAAAMIRVHNTVYIQMIKVPGKPLSKISQEQLNETIGSYHAMLERLNDLDITHADLHYDNVLYDPKTDTFNPIDFRQPYTEKHLQNATRVWNDTVNFGQATTFRYEIDMEHASAMGRTGDNWNGSYLAPPLRCKLFWNTKL